MKTAQQLFDENFTHNTTRCKRSAAYKKGALTVLKYKIHGGELPEVPYKPGSTEFDAYFAGVGEAGNILARETAFLEAAGRLDLPVPALFREFRTSSRLDVLFEQNPETPTSQELA